MSRKVSEQYQRDKTGEQWDTVRVYTLTRGWPYKPSFMPRGPMIIVHTAKDSDRHACSIYEGLVETALRCVLPCLLACVPVLVCGAWCVDV